MNLYAPNNLSATETVSDELDRLAILSGKIGMNTSEQSFSLLHGLDDVYQRIQSLEENTQSRRIAQTQLDGIVANLHREAAIFIHDLGGAQALRRAREETQSGMDQPWWYLDTWLADKRRKALRRSLTVIGLVVLAVVILGVIYQRFLAPNPQTVALYNSEQSSGQSLSEGDPALALKQVDEGLKIVPGDPNLLILKGVIQEVQGQKAQAVQSYAAAQKGLSSLEEFLLTRSQDYFLANRFTQALADAQQAVQINPDSAQGYLLIGQAHEMQGQYRQALDDYDRAYAAANKINMPALAVIARQRTALIYQSLGNLETPSPDATVTP